MSEKCPPNKNGFRLQARPFFSNPDMPLEEDFALYGEPWKNPDAEDRKATLRRLQRQYRRNLWIERMYAEATASPYISFLTLTIGNPQPTYGQAVHLLQNWLKLLRIRNPLQRFRYFAAADFGALNGRIHFHLVVYSSKDTSKDQFKDPWITTVQKFRKNFIGPLEIRTRERKKLTDWLVEREGEPPNWTSQKSLRKSKRVEIRNVVLRASPEYDFAKNTDRTVSKSDRRKLPEPIPPQKFRRVFRYVASYTIPSAKQMVPDGVSLRPQVSTRPLFGTRYSPEYLLVGRKTWHTWLNRQKPEYGHAEKVDTWID